MEEKISFLRWKRSMVWSAIDTMTPLWVMTASVTAKYGNVGIAKVLTGSPAISTEEDMMGTQTRW
ncbi:hypothetical protein KCP73_04865 [Salmonella enterica subsp. enterica]|nr:hypothetical protein KCP73_04865 [Salmonella enterica subsp. enterica]